MLRFWSRGCQVVMVGIAYHLKNRKVKGPCINLKMIFSNLTNLSIALYLLSRPIKFQWFFAWPVRKSLGGKKERPSRWEATLDNGRSNLGLLGERAASMKNGHLEHSAYWIYLREPSLCWSSGHIKQNEIISIHYSWNTSYNKTNMQSKKIRGVLDF